MVIGLTGKPKGEPRQQPQGIARETGIRRDSPAKHQKDNRNVMFPLSFFYCLSVNNKRQRLCDAAAHHKLNV